jgi:RiboL-PSP-HEPN
MIGRREVARLKSKLDATLKRAPSPTADIEFQADFAKYFCILVSGFLENSLIALVLDFVQKKSSEEVQLFVEKRLDRWTSPNTEKILGLLGEFNADWKKRAEDFIVDDRKATVNSLVGLRHQIAHGESVGTSIAQVKDYYKGTVEVVEFIADLIDPPL